MENTARRTLFADFADSHDIRGLLQPPEAYLPCPPLKDRSAWEGLPAPLRERLLSLGREALDGYPMLTAAQFMAFTRSGSRQVFEAPYFERRKKLIYAVLAECVSDSGEFMDVIVDGIWCILEETSWVLSAHNGSDHPGMRPQRERVLPDPEDPYVDLFAAQTAASLADILYLLEDRLDAVSPLIARRVRREIDLRVLTPFLHRDDFWWMGVVRQDVNNWTPWILSNVLECLLLLERDGVRRAEGVVRAMRMLDRYLNVLPEDGGCDEGAGYFNMAGASLFDCLDSLDRASAGRISFWNDPFLKAVCTWPAHAHIAGKWFINFADCDAMPYLDAETLCRIGRRMRLGNMLSLGRELRQPPEAFVIRDTPQMNRLLGFLFPEPDEPDTATPVLPDHDFLPKLEVFSWRRGRLYGAVKGGHNLESHNHNDVGTVIVFADGKPQVIDLGNRIYTAQTFGPRRYELPNTRSANHNLPLIGGIEQAAGTNHRAEVLVCRDDEVSMEIGSAWPEDAGIFSVRRTMRRAGDGFVLSDAIRLADEKDVAWIFMLAEEPSVSPGLITLSGMTIAFDAGLTPAWTHLPADDARMARNWPDGAWRLTLTVAPSRDHSAVFTMKAR